VAESVTAGRASGTVDYIGRNDGMRRVISFRAVAGSPYIVSVGRAHVDLLSHWWSDLWRYLIVTLALIAAALVACWYLLRQMAAWERTDAVSRAGELSAAGALRQSQAQERQTRERLETILDRMPLGCIVTDANLRMTYVNKSAERIFGCRFEDIKGRTPLETGFVVPAAGR
jgi:PAS domain-containing protein